MQAATFYLPCTNHVILYNGHNRKIKYQFLSPYCTFVVHLMRDYLRIHVYQNNAYLNTSECAKFAVLLFASVNIDCLKNVENLNDYFQNVYMWIFKLHYE